MTLLSGHIKRKKILAALEKLTDNVVDAYDGVMGRISEQGEDRRTIASMALKWVTYAKERLTIDQLLHAIELGLDPDCNDIDNDDLVGPDEVLSCCMGLLTLNREDQTIRLVHFTTQGYIETQIPNIESHTSLAKSRLTYLAFDVFVFNPRLKERRELVLLKKRYPLSGYAAGSWGYHARLGAEKDLIQAILSTLSTQAIRDMIETLRWALDRSWQPGPTLLHCTSRDGLSQTSAVILNEYVRSTDPSETRLTD
jgi:hypothetical protein